MIVEIDLHVCFQGKESLYEKYLDNIEEKPENRESFYKDILSILNKYCQCAEEDDFKISRLRTAVYNINLS